MCNVIKLLPVIAIFSWTAYGAVAPKSAEQFAETRRAKIGEPKSALWATLDQSMSNSKISSKGRYLAFTRPDGQGLSVLDLKTKAIREVTAQYVGPSFFWAPDGRRLVYRELLSDLASTQKSAAPSKSVVAIYDPNKFTSSIVTELSDSSGYLTFDPRDLRFYLMHGAGIFSRRLSFPSERLALWQVSQRTDEGRWVATQSGMIWVTQAGFAIQKLDDDGSGVESFAVSPDGSSCAWTTKNGKIFVSRNGEKPKFIDEGRDPAWHPEKPILLYAGARMVGKVAVSYDLKISDLKGPGTFLTTTQESSERWPQWDRGGQQVIYTLDKTREIHVLAFKNE